MRRYARTQIEVVVAQAEALHDLTALTCRAA
jgi:hypothetical protein